MSACGLIRGFANQAKAAARRLGGYGVFVRKDDGGRANDPKGSRAMEPAALTNGWDLIDTGPDLPFQYTAKIRFSSTEPSGV